jgi:hypothetical protein
MAKYGFDRESAISAVKEISDNPTVNDALKLLKLKNTQPNPPRFYKNKPFYDFLDSKIGYDVAEAYFRNPNKTNAAELIASYVKNWHDSYLCTFLNNLIRFRNALSNNQDTHSDAKLQTNAKIEKMKALVYLKHNLLTITKVIIDTLSIDSSAYDDIMELKKKLQNTYTYPEKNSDKEKELENLLATIYSKIKEPIISLENRTPCQIIPQKFSRTVATRNIPGGKKKSRRKKKRKKSMRKKK